MKSNPLTILLTLKGRHFHTLRWVWHANRIHMPFHVIIADGEVNPEISRVLERQANFPNLSFEYHRYEDKSYSDFYRKCADAVARVSSPFVMMSDNDDFPMPTGILRSITFLEQAKDYVGGGGGIAGFELDSCKNCLPPNITGRLKSIAFRYAKTDYFTDVSFPSVVERIRFAAKEASGLYYNVFRTEVLRLVFKEMQELDFSVLQIAEHFITLRSLTLGKSHCDETAIFYVRQIGTSSNIGRDRDWVDHLLRSRYTSDFAAMASCLAQSASTADVADQCQVEEIIREAYGEFLRSQLTRLYGIPRVLNLFKKMVRPIVPSCFFDFRSRGYKSFKAQRRNFVERLKQAGASRDYLDSFNLELRQIEETLEGRGFLDFLHSTVGKDLSALY